MEKETRSYVKRVSKRASIAASLVMGMRTLSVFAQTGPEEITDFIPTRYDEPFNQCGKTIGLEEYSLHETIQVTVVRNAAGQPIDYLHKPLGENPGTCELPPVCDRTKGIDPALWTHVEGILKNQLTLDPKNPGNAGEEWRCGIVVKFSNDIPVPYLERGKGPVVFHREPYRHEDKAVELPWEQRGYRQPVQALPKGAERMLGRNVPTGMLRTLRSAY